MTRSAALALALPLLGCSADLPPPAERLDRLLARMHGVVRGKLDRSLLELRTDGERWTVLRAPDGWRARDEGSGRMQFRAGDEAWLQGPGAGARELTPVERTALAARERAVAALLLLPLAAAVGPIAAEPQRIRFQCDGRSWELELDEQERPLALRTDGTAVEFVEWQDNGVTVLPIRVRIDGAEWRVRILEYDVVADPAAFRPRRRG